MIFNDDIAMTTTPSEAAGHRPMRVLFVEDNADVREVVALLLQEQALDVLTCDSAESAEAAFSASHFDVLLTDVSLPAMSGVELARRLLRQQSGLWVVFLSGHAMEAHLEALGPQVRYLRKPFHPEALHAMVEEIRARLG
jgi:DNA-binding response OmpR family regulator